VTEAKLVVVHHIRMRPITTMTDYCQAIDGKLSSHNLNTETYVLTAKTKKS